MRGPNPARERERSSRRVVIDSRLSRFVGTDAFDTRQARNTDNLYGARGV
jgi:hypothetical protein